MLRFSEEALFTLGLLGFGGLMLYLTLDLGRVARLVPLAVAIPTLAILVFQLLLDLVPRLAQCCVKFERFERREESQNQIRTDKARAEGETALTRRELNEFLWIIMILGFIYLFGFIIAVLLYTLLYFRIRAKEGWLFSLASAAGMCCLLYGLFVIVLSASLYKGKLWIWLGL